MSATARMPPVRRMLAIVVVGLLALATALTSAGASERRHGLSVFGDLKYPADFAHFDYADPAAPKGGKLVTIGTLARATFDSFNNFIPKGDAAQGLELLFDTLMKRALDEPDAVYGLVADWAEVADDGRAVTFHLRPEARFSDGAPVTAEDLVFTLETLREKGDPSYSLSLRDVAKAEVLAPDLVRYTFTGEQTRDLPIMVAQLPVLSKAFYTKQPFDQTSLVPPVGSGPYRIDAFKPGSWVTYRRRDDYWAKDLPVNRGQYNFDEVKYDYYGDPKLGLEALMAGYVDLREEFSSKDWKFGYDTPAVQAGRVVKEMLPDATPSGTQGFFMNLRRARFQDPRVREAIGLAFDFEWMSKNLFYGAYTRTDSYFETTDMQATGPASDAEAALLAPFRDKLPPEVLGPPVSPPVTDGTGRPRANLKRASALLDAAGWKVDPNDPQIRRNAAGEIFELEILDRDDSFQRVILPFIANLKILGIRANLRIVDPAQYEERVQRGFDFDMVSVRFVLRPTPGVELRAYWSSAAAPLPGSLNLAGIADPVVDAMIERMVAARSRAELVTAGRALDRVLRAGHYWVPHWHLAAHRLAYWNKLSRPPVSPSYPNLFHELWGAWWLDAEKAAKLSAP